MRTLVTGGAGFIGSTLVDALLDVGHQVTVVDDLSTGRRSNLESAMDGNPGSLRIVETDIRDLGLRDLVIEQRPEVIFHLAAHIDVRASVTDPLRDAEINVLGTINLASAAVDGGVRKIVFASSGGSIYGDPATLPATETTAVEPLSPYAVAKVSAELYLNAFSRLTGLHCTHTAFANVYGPRQDPFGEAGVVAIFTSALLSGRPTMMYGDGGNTRDYVFVDDVVSAILLASGEAGNRQRFNIGTGVQTSDRELHSVVAQAIGCADAPTLGPARMGDLRHSALDGSLARTELGWQPRFDLDRGIAATVAYFRRIGLGTEPLGQGRARR